MFGRAPRAPYESWAGEIEGAAVTYRRRYVPADLGPCPRTEISAYPHPPARPDLAVIRTLRDTVFEIDVTLWVQRPPAGIETPPAADATGGRAVPSPGVLEVVGPPVHDGGQSGPREPGALSHPEILHAGRARSPRTRGCSRSNSLLKMTTKALRSVSLAGSGAAALSLRPVPWRPDESGPAAGSLPLSVRHRRRQRCRFQPDRRRGRRVGRDGSRRSLREVPAGRAGRPVVRPVRRREPRAARDGYRHGRRGGGRAVARAAGASGASALFFSPSWSWRSLPPSGISW
jgi:hypothetical protein